MEHMTEILSELKGMILAGTSVAEAIEELSEEYGVAEKVIRIRAEKAFGELEKLTEKKQAAMKMEQAQLLKKNEKLREKIEKTAALYGVPVSMVREMRGKDGETYSVIGRISGKKTYKIKGVSHLDHKVYNIRSGFLVA